MYTKISYLGFQDPLSSIIHLLTAFAAIYFGLRLLLKSRGNALRVTSISFYLFCCIYLFSMSGVYHILTKNSTSAYVLRILDHTGIYLMIAGSFTPFQIILLRGYRRWVPLIITWILAITGLTLTSIFFNSMPEWLLLSFFLSMGWMSLVTVWFIKDVCPGTVKKIFIGGVLYTIGATFDFLRWPVIIPGIFEAHEIFHLFITAAAVVHFKAIYDISNLPISDKLVVIIKEFPSQFTITFKNEYGILKSLNESDIKGMIKDWIQNHFLEKLKPKKIILRYFKEDTL